MTTLIPTNKALVFNPVVLAPEYDCPAITRCTDAWNRAHIAALAAGKGAVWAIVHGNQAYRNAMPPLNTPENIRDFIACVTHGVLFRAILDDVAPRLIYGAKAASSAVKLCAPQKPQTSRPKKPSRPRTRKTSTRPLPSAAL